MNLRERLARLSPAMRARLEARLAQAPATPPEQPAAVAPLTHDQEALWLRDGLFPGSAAGNLHVAYRLAGPVDAAALARSLARLMARHAVLRTCHGERDGRPAQWKRPDCALPFAVVDLGDGPADDVATAFATAEASHIFVLAADPPWRARLGRLAAGSHVFTLCMHEIASDGRSFAVLLAELAAIYGEEALGRPAALPGPGEAHAVFAARQRRRLAHALPRLRADACARFAGVTPCLPLTDQPRPLVPEFRGARRHIELEPAVADALIALGRSVGATPFMVSLAVLALLLHRRLGAAAVAIPVATDGRTPEHADTVGYFLEVVPVISRLDPHADARGFLAQIRGACIAALRAGELPFSELYAALAPAATSPTSVFPILFAAQNMGSLALTLPGVRAERLAIDNGTCNFEMAWFMDEAAGGLTLELRHDSVLFSDSTAAGWLADYARLAAMLAADPSRRLATLPVSAAGAVVASTPDPLPPRPLTGVPGLAGAVAPMRASLILALDLFHPLLPADLPRALLLELAEQWLATAGSSGLARLARVPLKLLGQLVGATEALDAWDLGAARFMTRVLAARLGVVPPPLPDTAPLTHAAILAWLHPFAIQAGWLAPADGIEALAYHLAQRADAGETAEK